MANLPEYFNVGDRKNIEPEELLLLIERLYTDISIRLNLKPDLVRRTQDGQTTDTFLPLGTLNLNTSSQKVEMLTSHISQVAVAWTQLS